MIFLINLETKNRKFQIFEKIQKKYNLLILFIINDFESSNIIIIARLKYSIKNDICFIFKLIITRKEIQYLRTILYFNKI